MTLSELQNWRKKTPFLISAACMIPWIVLRFESIGTASLLIAVSGALALFYVLLKLRAPRWKAENDRNVGAQIRNSLITLVPPDLAVTPAEHEQLTNSEIYKQLNGVFWEAVDGSQRLRDQKQHFYSNGLEYTTAIDGYLFFMGYGLGYALAFFIIGDLAAGVWAAVLLGIGLVCKFVALPRARRQHLRLSDEQLDLLRREQGELVSNRFREIVLGWRARGSPVAPSQPPRPQRSIFRTEALSMSAAVTVLVVVAIASRGSVGFGSGVEVGSSYITNGNHNKSLVVVFVHGIFGTRTDTWLGKGATESFPQLLATDPELTENADVFAFEYFTPRLGKAPPVVDLADQLRGDLDASGVFENHRNVVFLAHSMGGIIVRQFLLSSQDRLAKVPMLFFYATPSNGSDLASIARLASANPQLRGLLPIEGNDLLQSIQSMWLGSDAAKSIASYCAIEELPTSGVMVVTRSSATSLCNRAIDPLSADHLDIVKPRSRTDPRYLRFKNALYREGLLSGPGLLPRRPSAAPVK